MESAFAKVRVGQRVKFAWKFNNFGSHLYKIPAQNVRRFQLILKIYKQEETRLYHQDGLFLVRSFRIFVKNVSGLFSPVKSLSGTNHGSS